LKPRLTFAAALFLVSIAGRPVPVHAAAAWCNDLIGVATYAMAGATGCPPGQKRLSRYVVTTTCSGANVPSVGHCSMFTGPQWIAVAGSSVDAPLGTCESSPHGPIIGISCDPEELPKQCPAGNATGAPSAYVGDPVDLTSGALKLTPTDVDLGGGLVWARHYVSTSTTTGPMGRGWLAGLGWSLVRSNVPMPPGAPMATIPGFLIQRPLRPPVFVLWDYTTLQYTTGIRQSGFLTVDPDTTVHFVDEDGTTVTFDPLDRLVALQLLGELPVAVTYGTDTATYSNGQQSLTVTNYASGHANAGRVSTVTANGETWSYGYDASQNLTTVTGPDPSTPSPSDTVTWTYVYTTPASSGRVTRLDRTVGALTTTIGSWTYVGSNPPRVATVDEPALEQALTLSYQVPEANRLKATLKNSSNQTLAVFDSTNNILYDVTNTTGPAAPVAGGAGISIDFTHATVGLVPGTTTVTQQYDTQVDANGNVTLFEGRDGRGRPARLVEGWIDGLTAPGVFSPDDTYARLREYTYHPVLDETLSITEESPLTGNFDKVTIFDYDDLVDPTDDPGIPNEKPTKHLFTKIERGHTLDAAGDVVPLEAITRYTYDSDGRILTQLGPRPESLTEHVYDPSGNRIALRRYLDGSGSDYLETTFSDFDARGNPRLVTDANGRSTSFTYDAADRITTVTPPFAGGISTITSTYDVDGNLVRVDFPHDSFAIPNFIRMGYDAKGRMTFIVDAQGNATVYEYTSGRVTRKALYAGFVDPSNRGSLKGDSTFGYDAAGRLVKAFNPLFPGATVFTEYERDAKGNTTKITDENGEQSNRLFDALDRLESVTLVRAGGSYTTAFAHDTFAFPSEITDPSGKFTQFIRDDLGRLVKVVSPNTGITVYSYDEAGNVVTKVEDFGGAARSTSYEYDGLDRVLVVDFASDPDWIFEYDGAVGLNQAGRLASVGNGIVSTEFEYTAQGQVAVERTEIGGNGYETAYAYDAAGNLASLVTPTGVGAAYAYSGNRPKTISVEAGGVSQVVRDIEFAPFGPRTRAEFPPEDPATGENTVVSTRAYDLRYNVTEIDVASNAGAILDLSYAYDFVGGSPGPVDPGPNLDRVIDHLSPSESRFFHFDDMGRLGRVSDLAGSTVIEYAYDANGNRMQEVSAAGTSTYVQEPGTDRLAESVGASAAHYAHDAYGNRIWAGASAYAGSASLVHDESNRLKQVRDPATGSVIADYSYDAFGRRVKKVSGGVSTLYFYARTQLLEQTSNGPTTSSRVFVFLENEPIGVVDRVAGGAATFAWLHGDHLGTPRAVSMSSPAAAPAVVWRANFAPFGKAAVDEDPDGDTQQFRLDLRLAGQVFDPESSLHYNYLRHADPDTGRFLESDPIGLGGGMNTFAFALSNPIMLSDPTGLQACGGGRCPPSEIGEDEQKKCCDHVRPTMQHLYPNIAGFVACCRGLKTVCYVAQGDPQLEDTFEECTRRHERTHTTDPLVVCISEDPNCDRYQRTTFVSETSERDGECVGYAAGLECLNSAVPKCGGDIDCERRFKKWINDRWETSRHYKCGIPKPSILRLGPSL
jgi:RHS repeat-associated protein